ncbi:uncharacterized protein LOC119641267 [Glossina fuscipes]|uniref:Uncharacterized protein LOC119641267 n=1 Tax=Glossina fuscipes TaxID=7396 RepID=A0A9C5Z897_9MUSC|nr:uncharacterized protein LOC119641267 [Glossina fuscipes]
MANHSVDACGVNGTDIGCSEVFLDRLKECKLLTASFDTSNTYSAQRTLFRILMPRKSRIADSSALTLPKEKGLVIQSIALAVRAEKKLNHLIPIYSLCPLPVSWSS